MLVTAFKCSWDSFKDSISKESNRLSCDQVIGHTDPALLLSLLLFC